MIQIEVLSEMVSSIDQDKLIDLYLAHEFSPSFVASEDSSEIHIESMLLDESSLHPVLGMEIIEDDMEVFEPMTSRQLEDVWRWIEESEEKEDSSSQICTTGDVWSPCHSSKSSEASVGLPLSHLSATIPGIDTEMDGQLRLKHLLKAYGEATNMGQEHRELAGVIQRSIVPKVNPVGQTLERVAFHLLQSSEKQKDYLQQESIKNFETAFRVFYQIFPYGRFAHLAADSAILEAIPDDAETIHIVDSGIEGVQWPPLFEALKGQSKAIRLTSITGEDEHSSALSPWSFEETKRTLRDYARSLGHRLTIDEMSLDDLVIEKKKLKRRGSGREWMAFNCKACLPHHGGKGRSRSQAMEFLGVAKEVLGDTGSNAGIIIFTDGEAGETFRSCNGFDSFFEGCLAHYCALFESMERKFPSRLADARLAVESIFLAPKISSISWLNKWEEEMKVGSDIEGRIGLEGVRWSSRSLAEATEMVQDKEGCYSVSIEGLEQNEMVLDWRGIPLLRVSKWM